MLDRYWYLPAFNAMRERSVRRFRLGQRNAVSNRSVFFRSFLLLFVALATLTQLTFAKSVVDDLANRQEVKLAIILTSVFIALMTLFDCWKTRDRIFSKLALSVFSISALWYLRASQIASSRGQGEWDITVGKRMYVIHHFVVAQMIIFVLYLIVYHLFPFFGRLIKNDFIVDAFFYRFKIIQNRFTENEDGSFEGSFLISYKPYGALCWRRTFAYSGGLDAKGLPHGHGRWTDDSFHGESISGVWMNGKPVGPFVSRENGSGGIFSSKLVLFATSRAEKFGEGFWYPQRCPHGLRYGLAAVEASSGGAFYKDLPRVNELKEGGGLEEYVGEYLERARCSGDAKVTSRVGRSFDRSFKVSTDESTGVTRILAADQESFNVLDSLIKSSVKFELECPPSSGDSAVHSSKFSDITALVFFHGFNCSLDYAACKIGQLMALSRLPANVVPFVFSHSAGRSLSYLPTLQALPDFAPDAADFIQQLSKIGIRKMHLLGHSLGCDLLFQTLLILDSRQCLASKRFIDPVYEPETACSGSSQRDHYEGKVDLESGENPKIDLQSLLLLNADINLDVFQKDLELGRTLERVTSRTTVYVDRSDRALFIAKLAVKKSKLGLLPKGRLYVSNPDVDLTNFLDVIDTTGMQQNVHSLRHSYFNLNMQIVSDIAEILKSNSPATDRSLIAKDSHVFHFLCPPAFLDADKGKV